MGELFRLLGQCHSKLKLIKFFAYYRVRTGDHFQVHNAPYTNVQRLFWSLSYVSASPEIMLFSDVSDKFRCRGVFSFKLWYIKKFQNRLSSFLSEGVANE